ncbi:unnamed protein product [Adineta steineri]|uniref:Uncharacterized protein n=1 Tax=Adineta steineri TaxID=433720 RepID=A0A818XW75_9BILA|nr:unnamed protein product [Adineta steineri]
MILADCLPRSDVIQMSNTMDKTILIEDLTKLSIIAPELTPIDDKPGSITPIKIPLVSFASILATSPKFILVNEFTKRKNQFILFDEHLQKSSKRSFIQQPIIDSLWYNKEEKFLLLTTENIYEFDPNTMKIELLQDIIPTENKMFKCFTLLNQSTLLIAYNEWGAEYIDKWEQDNENGSWKLIGKMSLALTYNEFIGNILTIIEDDSSYLMMTIYNNFTEQWRLEIRDMKTFLCHQAILLPGSNIMHDYWMLHVKNTESDSLSRMYETVSNNQRSYPGHHIISIICTIIVSSPLLALTIFAAVHINQCPGAPLLPFWLLVFGIVGFGAGCIIVCMLCGRLRDDDDDDDDDDDHHWPI